MNEERIINWEPKEKFKGVVRVEQELVPCGTDEKTRTVQFEGGVKVKLHKEILQCFYYTDREE